MSKIVITADTEDNTINVKVDNELYENVAHSSVSLHTPYGEDEEELMCYICLKPEEVGGLMKETKIATASSKEGLAIKNSPNVEILSENSKIIVGRIRQSLSSIVAKILHNGKKVNK